MASQMFLNVLNLTNPKGRRNLNVDCLACGLSIPYLNEYNPAHDEKRV